MKLWLGHVNLQSVMPSHSAPLQVIFLPSKMLHSSPGIISYSQQNQERPSEAFFFRVVWRAAKPECVLVAESTVTQRCRKVLGIKKTQLELAFVPWSLPGCWSKTKNKPEANQGQSQQMIWKEHLKSQGAFQSKGVVVILSSKTWTNATSFANPSHWNLMHDIFI